MTHSVVDAATGGRDGPASADARRAAGISGSGGAGTKAGRIGSGWFIVVAQGEGKIVRVNSLHFSPFADAVQVVVARGPAGSRSHCGHIESSRIWATATYRLWGY